MTTPRGFVIREASTKNLEYTLLEGEGVPQMFKLIREPNQTHFSDT